jgi:hypothetical protein
MYDGMDMFGLFFPGVRDDPTCYDVLCYEAGVDQERRSQCRKRFRRVSIRKTKLMGPLYGEVQCHHASAGRAFCFYLA